MPAKRVQSSCSLAVFCSQTKKEINSKPSTQTLFPFQGKHDCGVKHVLRYAYAPTALPPV